MKRTPSDMIIDRVTGVTVAAQLADVAIQLGNRIDPEVDDKPRILRMFEKAKLDGKRAVVLPKGTYTQATQLDLDSYSNLVVIGDGATINFTYNTDSTGGVVKAWNIINSSYMTITGLKIESQNRSLTKQWTGINLTNCQHIALDRVNIQNFGWIGINIQDATEGTSHNINIDNCIIEYCRFGIWSNGHFVFIQNKTYISNHWSLSTEATSQGSKPIWKPTATDSEWYDGIIIKGKYWIVTECIIEDNGQSGIYSGGTKYGTIAENIIKNNWNKGVDFGATRGTDNVSTITHITVQDNMCQDNKTGQIHFSKCDNIKVIGNDALLFDTTYSDVSSYVKPVIFFVGECYNNIIEGNIAIQNYTTVSAIELKDTLASGNIVRGNKAIGTIKYDVALENNVLVEDDNGISKFRTNVQFLKNITKGMVIDLTNLSGYDGRNVLTLKPSSDNTYAQMTATAPVRLLQGNGSYQDLNVGGFRATSATLLGQIFFDDAASLRLPRAAQTDEGLLWYDTNDDTVKFRAGNGITKTIATV